jgi:hypothetical protein
MTDQAESKGWIVDLVAAVLKELRQYGVAAIVMLICMAALWWLFQHYEEKDSMQDTKLAAVNEKVFVAFTENIRANERNAEAQEKTTRAQEQTVKAIDDLRAEIRSRQ